MFPMSFTNGEDRQSRGLKSLNSPFELSTDYGKSDHASSFGASVRHIKLNRVYV